MSDQHAESVAESQPAPVPSKTDAIEALAYVMAASSLVIHPDLMARLRTVWWYVKERTDG